MSEPFWVPLGGGGVDYKGDFNPATQYQSGDVVRYRGLDFLAVNPSLGTTPPAGGVSGSDVPRVLDRVLVPVESVSETAERTLYSFVVPGGIMGTNRTLRLLLKGDFLFNVATGNVMQVRVKFGGSTLISNSTAGGALSANRRPWKWETIIQNLGAVNLQDVWSEILSSTDGPPTTGIGDTGKNIFQAGNNPNEHGGGGSVAYPGSAIDTSVDQLLALTVQWGASSASQAFRLRSGFLEVI